MASGDNLILNFSVPAQSIYRNKAVASVTIPVSPLPQCALPTALHTPVPEPAHPLTPRLFHPPSTNKQGLAGEYGVTKGHSPIISELKAGVVQITHEPGQAPEKYFVSGGFALTHANSVTDIAVVEAAKLDDIDPEAVPKIYAEAVKDMNAAPEVLGACAVHGRTDGAWDFGVVGLWSCDGWPCPKCD